MKQKNNEKKEPDTPLQIYYQNFGGLRTKLIDFLLAVSTLFYDVVIVCESWINNDYSVEKLDLCRYQIFRADRYIITNSKTRSGGVLIALENKIPTVKPISDFQLV